jgi:ElaB/YqjD/DUF883 family membrane-anchored ribosome-binding protein
MLDDLEELFGEASQEELEELEGDVEKMIEEAEKEIEEAVDDLLIKALKKYL